MMTLLQVDSTALGPFGALQQYGLSGLVILGLGFLSWLFIRNMMTKQEKLENFVTGELKEMSNQMISVVENNTTALTDIQKELNEFRKEIEHLNNKIQNLQRR